MSTTPVPPPKITVDRTSDVPLYSQIAEALATLILDGTLAPGTRIEDEGGQRLGDLAVERDVARAVDGDLGGGTV